MAERGQREYSFRLSLGQTPHHPVPACIPSTSRLAREPDPRPRHLVITDDTEIIPPKTDEAFPLWINKFILDKPDEDLESNIEQLANEETTAATFFRPKSYTIKRVAGSPRYSDASSGFMLALLDSSLNVSVFGFKDGARRGAEQKLFNLTAEQLKLQGPLPSNSSKSKETTPMRADVSQTRLAQLRTTTIAWSSAPPLPSPYGRTSHASLLAVGNRAGQIQLWR